jgi:hypothetical protein
MNLTFLQRIRRRINLLRGSYEHPDGTLELDFDETAGIDPTLDSDEVQLVKLKKYFEQNRDNSDGTRGVAAIMIATAIYLVAEHVGLTGWKLWVIPGLFSLGLPALVTGRWKNW